MYGRNAGFGRGAKNGALALLLGAVCMPGLDVSSAKADAADVAREVVNGVIQNILQNVRDQVRRRTTARPPSAPLRFSGEESSSASIYDEAFGALAYNGMPRKAAPFQVAPAVVWMYGIDLSGSYDVSRTTGEGGTTSKSYTAAGAGNVTKVGIFNTSDSLTFVLLGSGTWQRTPGVGVTPGTRATTDTVGGTIMYANRNFSTDHTYVSQSTHSSVAGGAGDATAWSYTGNVQYRFDLQHSWYIEPTVGVTFSHTDPKPINAPDAEQVEVYGGIRFGTVVMWNGVGVSPSFTGVAFSPVDTTPNSPQEGHVGGRGSVKLNFQWTQNFATYIDGHASGIHNDRSYGTTGGLSFTW